MSNRFSSFWQDRPTLVTGATGLVGGWLVRQLLQDGADVVCLVRDWVPQSNLILSGLIDRVKSEVIGSAPMNVGSEPPARAVPVTGKRRPADSP